MHFLDDSDAHWVVDHEVPRDCQGVRMGLRLSALTLCAWTHYTGMSDTSVLHGIYIKLRSITGSRCLLGACMASHT